MSNIVFERELPCGIFSTHSQKPDFNVKKCQQIHSPEITKLKDLNSSIKSDGIIAPFDSSDPLAIVTADCLPILLASHERIVFLHAGWKGLATKILEHPLISKINVNYAFIGPHISVKNYEVSPDFKKKFPNSLDSFTIQDGKNFFNLEKEVRRQLSNLYGTITIESSNICTYENQEFHSYRRNQTSSRNWNIYIKK